MSEQSDQQYKLDTQYIDKISDQLNAGEIRFLRASAKAAAASMGRLEFLPFVAKEINQHPLMALIMATQLVDRGIVLGILCSGEPGLTIEITREAPNEPINESFRG